MCEIPLTDGKVAIVDDSDFNWLTRWRWRFQDRGPGYAVRGTGGRWLLMHRVIMEAAPGELIGHINGNTLDNRRANLYRSDRSRLGSQQRPQAGSFSRYKGVTWNPGNACWQARIRVQGRRISLGCFGSEEEAARAYDQAALQHFGPIATLNFK